MRIGYARVSTRDQNLEMQLDALNKAGCGRIFTDKLSGAQLERPGLKDALSHLREADTLVVWKLVQRFRYFQSGISEATDISKAVSQRQHPSNSPRKGDHLTYRDRFEIN